VRHSIQPAAPPRAKDIELGWRAF